jgi:hypothetical protein
MDRIYELSIKGTTPIMFYNPRLSDPLDEYTRELKKFTKMGNEKSEDDHREMSKIEFMGALHIDEKLGPYIPSEMIERVLRDGARRGLGKKFDSFVRGDDPLGFKLEYKGPRDRAGLWEAGTFVDRRSASTNGRTRVMRTRPIFRHWSCATRILVIDGAVDQDQLRDAAVAAGTRGMGSYKKRFGRFEVTGLELLTKGSRKAA